MDEKLASSHFCVECGMDLGREYSPPIACSGCEMALRYENSVVPIDPARVHLHVTEFGEIRHVFIGQAPEPAAGFGMDVRCSLLEYLEQFQLKEDEESDGG